MTRLNVISPVDNSTYYSCDLNTPRDIEQALVAAQSAQAAWQATPLNERKKFVQALVNNVVANKDDIATELCWQMGRPVSQGGGELAGFQERGNYMIKVAEQALKTFHPEPIDGFERYIEREPLGVVAVLSPWNYPFLTSVNAIVPALLAGNAVILKHAAQTPLVAERYAKAAKLAGIPKGVLQILKLSHAHTEKLIADPRVDGVFFTGSVAAGKAVQSALNDKFVPCGLELGGKDPAYVRADADVANAAENLVDGAFFNSGQSCCGIERIYVDASVYDEFVEKFVEVTKQYRLGNPTDPDTNLGPLVKTAAANFVREQIAEAVAQGAKSLVDESLFPASKAGTPYLSPHVLVDVTHDMRVMTEESFGPVVGIMKVSGDDEAVALMNDSDYGLTASIWSNDLEAARQLGGKIATGTVFLNRCDYLDPALAWTGVKDTGRGVTLSALGFDHVTRLKSYHLRKP
ncbi:MAG: aldehyde dehydrogenase [Gammaproteobacteria bacterium]|nr:MAG: aldehyde dehydrogenase [Gammaproteobacteria bacterium]